MKSTGKPTAITMCIGTQGDLADVSPGECAVRLARAGNLRRFVVGWFGLFCSSNEVRVGLPTLERRWPNG